MGIYLPHDPCVISSYSTKRANCLQLRLSISAVLSDIVITMFFSSRTVRFSRFLSNHFASFFKTDYRPDLHSNQLSMLIWRADDPYLIRGEIEFLKKERRERERERERERIV